MINTICAAVPLVLAIAFCIAAGTQPGGQHTLFYCISIALCVVSLCVPAAPRSLRPALFGNKKR